MDNAALIWRLKSWDIQVVGPHGNWSSAPWAHVALVNILYAIKHLIQLDSITKLSYCGISTLPVCSVVVVVLVPGY